MTSPIILPNADLPRQLMNDGQKDCIDKLEEALKEARRGNIHTVGIIVCMKKGYAATIGGTNAAELNLGCDSLKKKILEAIEG